MSAALYFYFWDTWTGSPAPAPSPTPAPPTPGTPGAGGGKGRGKGPKPRLAYERPTVDFWDVREAFLRTLYPEELPPAPPPDDVAADYEREVNRAVAERAAQIEQLNAERAATIAALRSSPDLQTMRDQGARIKEINDKIAELTGKQSVARFMQ